MAKEYLKMEDVLDEITAVKKPDGEFSYNRFNRKSFNKLITAMLNDPEFTFRVSKLKNGEIKDYTDIPVTKNLRKFFEKILIKSGIDKNESGRVLTEEFQFDTVDDSLYDFMTAAMMIYLRHGNKFDLPQGETSRYTLSIKEKGKKTKKAEVFSPQSRESLGVYETEVAEHEELVVKNHVPQYLKKRRKLS